MNLKPTTQAKLVSRFAPPFRGILRNATLSTLLAVALVVIGLVATGYSRLRQRAETTSSHNRLESRFLTASQSGADLEAELITILPTGFEPAEITRPAGRFILAIDNRSGLEEVNLRLSRANGQAVHELRIRREKPDLRKLVDLQPGVYRLSEANHPDWIGRLTITEP